MKQLIEQAQHIVIFTHMAPDGDAMGSSLALWHWIKGLPVTGDGLRDVTVIVPNAFPAFLSWMPGADRIRIYEKESDACNQLIADADLFICTDFNDPKRIGLMGEKMLANKAKKILIDHHLMANGEWLRANVDEVHSFPEASSSCEIVYRLLAEEGLQVTGDGLTTDIATCIYTGLMTDTGNFSYNSANCEIYEIVADLVRAGVKKEAVYDAVFNQYSTDRMRLTGYALYRKMRIYPEYHLALITLDADELDRFHYQQGDCEGLVNMPLQIGDVYYSVTMREERAKPGTPKSRIRISFRSQGDRPVNIWASEVFHGGGHMNASGGEVIGSLNQAVRLFEDTYKKYLKI
jgi:phosphoesterase RecJ-like protein